MDRLAELDLVDPAEEERALGALADAQTVVDDRELGGRLDDEDAREHGVAGEVPAAPELVPANVLPADAVALLEVELVDPREEGELEVVGDDGAAVDLLVGELDLLEIHRREVHESLGRHRSSV